VWEILAMFCYNCTTLYEYLENVNNFFTSQVYKKGDTYVYSIYQVSYTDP